VAAMWFPIRVGRPNMPRTIFRPGISVVPLRLIAVKFQSQSLAARPAAVGNWHSKRRPCICWFSCLHGTCRARGTPRLREEAKRRCEATHPGTCIQPAANPSGWVAEATRKDQHGPARWVLGLEVG
jgi:hypothetical protein